jgi:hypothetical protein
MSLKKAVVRITSDLVGEFCQLSRMAITNDLASVVCSLSQMASCFTSSFFRLRRLTPIKTNPYPDTFAHLSGDAVAADNSMKICVNLRNLRIELRFLG